MTVDGSARLTTAHPGESGRWSRTHHQGQPGVVLSYTEFLDLDAATARLNEAVTQRPDAAVRDWLDHALNGTLGDVTPNEAA